MGQIKVNEQKTCFLITALKYTKNVRSLAYQFVSLEVNIFLVLDILSC